MPLNVRKKKAPPHQPSLAADFGTDDDDLNINDASLQAELAQLIKESGGMDGLQMSDDDGVDDSDVDENDASLLAELQSFAADQSDSDDGRQQPATANRRDKEDSSHPKLSIGDVNERIEEYELALALLTSLGSNSGKLQRIEVGLKDLRQLRDRVSNGEQIDAKQLPPKPPSGMDDDEDNVESDASTSLKSSDVKTKTVAPTPPVSRHEDQLNNVRQNVLDTINPKPLSPSAALTALKRRHHEYKLAAIEARDAGNRDRAKALLQAYKFIGDILPKIESGEEPFDPDSDMPPPPSEFEADEGGGEEAAPDQTTPTPAVTPAPSGENQSETSSVMQSPVVTRENLRARMAFYQTQLDQIKSDPSQSAKARRLGRTLQYYQEACKAFDKGNLSHAYASLAPPPGCPPLAQPTTGPRPSTTPQTPSAAGRTKVNTTQSGAGPPSQRVVQLLVKRQQELRLAAAKCKRDGKIVEAKEFLRASLSINPMLQAAEAGLPVDLNQLPRSPSQWGPPAAGGAGQAVGSSTGGGAACGGAGPILTGVKCEPPTDFLLDLGKAHNDNDRNKLLMAQLNSQLEQAHHMWQDANRMGEAKLAGKMTGLVDLTKRSLSILHRLRTAYNSTPADYFFERANLPSLNANLDLSESVFEVTVLRGIAFNTPTGSPLDTYVELQLPFPNSEEGAKHTTDWVKGTNDPDYVSSSRSSVVSFQVDTKSRSFGRFVSGRRTLRAVVFYSRGMFKKAGVLGSAQFPLSDLVQSASCEVTGDLIVNRKPVGGRLQLRMRMRQSLMGPRIVSTSKPWLIINPPPQHSGHQQRSLDPAAPGQQRSASPVATTSPGRSSQRPPASSGGVDNLHSLYVLRFKESQLARDLINPSLSDKDRLAIRREMGEIGNRKRQLTDRLASASPAELTRYKDELRRLGHFYLDQSEAAVKQQSDVGQRRAERLRERAQLVKQELDSL